MTTLEELLARALPQDDVKLSDGTAVRVRGLSRAEVVGMKGMERDALEAAVLVAGLVDPHLPPERVGEFLAALTNDEVDEIIETVHRLSGLGGGQAKADYKSTSG